MWSRAVTKASPIASLLQSTASRSCRSSSQLTFRAITSLPYSQFHLFNNKHTSIPSNRPFSSSPTPQIIHPSPSSQPPASESPLPFDVHTNPYKARRQWPPDISKLSEKQQFRLERKYRRRAKLRYARPGWTKATKLVQSFAVVGVIIYAIFFMELEGHGENPFQGIRTWVKGLFGDAFTKTQRRKANENDADRES